MSWKVLNKLKSCVVCTSLEWQNQLTLLQWSHLSVSRTDGRGNKQTIKSNDFKDNIGSSQVYKKVRAWKRKDGRKWCSSLIIGAERWRLAWCGAEKKRCFHRLTAFEAEWRWSLNGTAAAVNAVRPLFCPATNTFDKYNQAKPNQVW